MGREASRPDAHPVAVLGSEARAASPAAGGPGSVLAPAYSQSTRDNSQGACRLGKVPNSPSLPWSPPSKACYRAETPGPREDRPALEMPITLYEQVMAPASPASSGLKAKLEAAVPSTLQILSSLFLLRMRSHMSAPNWLSDAN